MYKVLTETLHINNMYLSKYVGVIKLKEKYGMQNSVSLSHNRLEEVYGKVVGTNAKAIELSEYVTLTAEELELVYKSVKGGK